MAPPLVLAPSDSVDALVNAIADATATNRTLLLKPGIHLTKPGRLQKIPIGAAGLRVRASSQLAGGLLAPVIKRRDHSILLDKPDDNLGLSFVPAEPTTAEKEVLQFQPDPNTAEEFAILVRGDIVFDSVNIDCNMDNQGLNETFETKVSHSAMFKFVGQKYLVDSNRFVYVAFRSVTLTGMTTRNGGYADDILFSRGYFNPNIQRVRIERLTAANRVNRKRSTVAFAGQCQNVVIRDVDIYRLEMEDTGTITYRDVPRLNAVFAKSSWTLENITAERIDLAANGKVYTLRGKNLTTTKAFQLHQAAGAITGGNLTFGDAHRLNRLDNFKFTDVTWNLAAVTGNVRGIRPNSSGGDPCKVAFVGNTFKVPSSATSGQVIDSEFSNDTANRVTATLTGCTYPDNFGRTTTRRIAQVRERGLWTFAKLDFGDRDRNIAVVRRADPDITLRYI